MVRTYQCENCKMLFIDPIFDGGIFVCPNCVTPEFEATTIKK